MKSDKSEVRLFGSHTRRMWIACTARSKNKLQNHYHSFTHWANKKHLHCCKNNQRWCDGGSCDDRYWLVESSVKNVFGAKYELSACYGVSEAKRHTQTKKSRQRPLCSPESKIIVAARIFNMELHRLRRLADTLLLAYLTTYVITAFVIVFVILPLHIKSDDLKTWTSSGYLISDVAHQNEGMAENGASCFAVPALCGFLWK